MSKGKLKSSALSISLRCVLSHRHLFTCDRTDCAKLQAPKINSDAVAEGQHHFLLLPSLGYRFTCNWSQSREHNPVFAFSVVKPVMLFFSVVRNSNMEITSWDMACADVVSEAYEAVLERSVKLKYGGCI